MTGVAAWKIRTVVASLIIPPSLHFISLNLLCVRLAQRSSRTAGPPSPPPDSIAWWVDRLLSTLPWPWHHTCLKRATTLFYLLRLSGCPVELQVGVRRERGGDLEAHAWLTLQGEPFLEPVTSGVPTFSPIATFG